MLIHIIPSLFDPFDPLFQVEIEIVDVSIQECGLTLIGGKDITARRPYPNQRYLVACRKVGRKAVDGILIEVDGWLENYTVATRWRAAGAVITHIAEHKVLDQDFGAVTDDMVLWQRYPDCYGTQPPSMDQPSMDVMTKTGLSYPVRSSLRPGRPRDVVEPSDADYSPQRVILRTEHFQLHTVEREQLLELASRRGFERFPDIKHAFATKPFPTSTPRASKKP